QTNISKVSVPTNNPKVMPTASALKAAKWLDQRPDPKNTPQFLPGGRGGPNFLGNDGNQRGRGSGTGTSALNNTRAQSTLPTAAPTGEASSSGSVRAGPALYYAPASYSSKTACGRYPYPPCK